MMAVRGTLSPDFRMGASLMHTYTSIHLHVIFATWDRAPILTPEIRPLLFPYLGGIARNLSLTPLAIGGYFEHVHMLVGISPTVVIADAVGKVKSGSSSWLSDDCRVRHFAWQRGYAAFSVSRSQLDVVRRYVERQEEHHKRVPFAEELEKFYRANGFAVPPAFAGSK